MQAVEQPVTFVVGGGAGGRGALTTENASPFRRTMTDYICSSSHFAVRLQSESYIYIINIYIYIYIYTHNICIYNIHNI